VVRVKTEGQKVRESEGQGKNLGLEKSFLLICYYLSSKVDGLWI